MHSPKTDLVETPRSFIIRMELAVKNFEWNIKDHQFLSVIYTKDTGYPLNKGDRLVYTETKYGNSIRRVKLPGKTNGEVISEVWDSGVWIIELEKESHMSGVLLETPSPQRLCSPNSPVLDPVEPQPSMFDENIEYTKEQIFNPEPIGSWIDECNELSY